MDESNPYLRIVQQDNATNIRQSLQTAIDKQPDTEARLQGLAKQYNLPVDAVRLDTGTVERRAKLDAVDYDTLAKSLPATGNLLSDPNKAALAHDDIDNLSAMEQSLHYLKNGGKALASGVFGFSEGVAGQAEAGADLLSQYVTGPIADAGILPVDIGAPVAQAFRGIRQNQRDWRDYLTPKGQSNLESGVYSGLQSLTQNVLTLPLAIATDNPNLALNAMALNTGGQSYGRARDKDVDPTKALIYGGADAAIEYATEQTGLNLLFKDLKVGSSLMKTLTNQIMPDMVGEQAATVLQDFNEWSVLHPEQTLKDYTDARPDAAIQTAIATAIGQGGMVTLAKTVDGLAARAQQHVDSAHQHAAGIEQINQLAAASKVMQRDPDTMRAFVDAALADENGTEQAIYIDAKSFAQSGVAQQIAEALPDVQRQLPEALAIGGEIKIPLSDYVTKIAPTQYAQPLIDHIRMEGEEFSRAGAAQYMENHAEEFQAAGERALAHKQADDNFQASTVAVKDAIKEQLKTVSRFTDKVNDHYASMLSSYFAVQAEKFGTTPEELFKQSRLNVASSGLLGRQVLSQSEIANRQIEQWANGSLPGGHIVQLGNPSELLQSFGMDNLPIHLTKSVLDKAKNKHTITPAELTGLADAIHAPIAVFASKQGDGHLVVLTELEHADGNIIAALDLNRSRDHFEVHDIRSLHPKNTEGVLKWIEAGLLLGYEKNKGREWLERNSGSNSQRGQTNAAIEKARVYDLGENSNTASITNQVYNQRRRAKRDDYTLDLFDLPAEAGKADSAETSTGGRLSRDDAPAGTYATRTQIVQENTRQLGTDRVDTPEQAAQALAYLSSSTVERFDALVTDKDGKPLAIVGSFKGAVGGTSVYPATVAGEAFRIEGAANIWFGHNHPSGINELSTADRDMNQKLTGIFRGSEITPRGIFAIAGPEGDGRKWVYDAGQPDAGDITGTPEKPTATHSIPVVERVYAEEGKLAPAINTPDKAKAVAQELSNGESGVLLMDNQHAPVAFIPMKSAESEQLRGNGRMDALHRGLSMANAASAIIVNQGDMTNNALMNLAGFFHSNEVRVLDVLDKNGDTMDSRAEAGLSFSRDTFNQGNDTNRGAFNPETRTITLLDKADLSTFLHEAGHFFLEMQMDLAINLRKEDDLIGTTPAQKQLMRDTDTLLNWFGLQSIEEWYSLDLEQKRSYHERFAEAFEKYLFEGKAPSLEMARIFASFRQWMKKVYEHVRDHFKDVELTDDVRSVFDRMLATDDEIKLAQQARSMMPLFADQAQSGMTPEEYAEYQAAGVDATSTAMEQLALKGLRDMQWLQNARNRELKKLQRQHDELRREVRSVVRTEVMAQPVYQAYSFLTRKLTADDKIVPPKAPKSDPNRVDASQDSLFVAIAKLGGLQRDQLTEEWDYDHDGRGLMPVFGKPLVRKTGGHSIEAMAEMLLDEGYLTPDQHGKHDLSEFEQKFSDELRGVKHYSQSVDGAIFKEEGIAGSDVVNPEGLGAGRFELSALQGIFLPEEVVNRIVHLKMTARDGLHPDIVSELFGFSSGDELVKALAAAPSPKEAIERLTDERMLQNYGELSTPEAIQRAADMAIHNEVRARFITTEANALAQATGSLRILGSAAKEFAEAMIGRIKVRDISPAQYARAEVRAAKAALKAEKAGKLDVAAAEKRNQIINVQATRAAYQAQDDVDAGLRYFRKLETENNAIDPEYKDQIYRELERFDLGKVTNKQLDRRKSLAQWVEAQKEQGYEPDIPIELLNDNKISYKDMTVEEFRGLVDTIKQIEHLGRLKNQLLTAKKNRNFEEVKQEIVGNIINHAGTRIADTRTPTTNAGRVLRGLKNFSAAHIKAATWARIMDGGQDGGSVWEYFIRSANDRGEYETTLRADATEKLTAILEPVLKMGKMGGKGQYFPSIDRSLNREMRLAMALNTGNDGNLQRLLDGEGWTIAQITPVLQTLTAEEWQAVQRIWDYFETYKPEIAAKERRVYGKEPNWVEPKPVIVQCKTAAGVATELRLLGGYYPIKYDPLASQRAEQHADAEDAKRQLQGAYTSATTRRSFTKNRSEMILGRPLLYSLSGVYSGINEVIHDLAWHEWLIDMNKLLKSHSIDQAIRGHYGPEVVRQFKTWEQDIAAGDVGPTQAGEIALGKLRQGISAAGLGFNAMSAAMQVLGFTQSIVRVGAPWMARGITRYIGDHKAAMKDVYDKSAFMQNRSRTRFRELNELRNRVQDETAAQAAIRSGTFFMMMKAQQMVDVPTWLGAYEKAIADLHEEDRAIALADQAVIDAQGGGQTKDLSAIERGGPAMRLFTVFYSFMNTALNLGVAQTMTEKKKAKLAVDCLMLYVVPPVLGFFLKEALTPGGGDDDWEELSKKLLAQQIDYLMGLMVIVREFSDGVKMLTGANDMGREYQGPAGLRLITDSIKLSGQIHQGEFDDAFRKAAINVIGDISGLPSAQVNRTITGAEALNEGKTINPAALAFGFRK